MNASALLDRPALRSRIGNRLARAFRARAETKVDLIGWGKRFFPDYFPLPPASTTSS